MCYEKFKIYVCGPVARYIIQSWNTTGHKNIFLKNNGVYNAQVVLTVWEIQFLGIKNSVR
jgi:hypothetical protein